MQLIGDLKFYDLKVFGFGSGFLKYKISISVWVSVFENTNLRFQFQFQLKMIQLVPIFILLTKKKYITFILIWNIQIFFKKIFILSK